MRAETFFDMFDELADANDAIATIRQLVLDLALSGRLIGLDASKWDRVSLGSLGEWGSGGTPLRSEPQYYGGSIPWLVIGDLNDGVVTSASSSITEEGLANSSARLLSKDVLLIAMYGSIGKMGITGIACATNQAIASCKPDPKRTDLRYLFHTLKGIQPALLARGKGLAQKNISQTILKAWEINLPPLSEQKRIVAKVDELMALCDRMEAQQQERETLQAVLNRAALARFSDAPTPSNLMFLFHTSYTISPADLRKSILTLAVQGKLVPQESGDEPVGAFLQRIWMDKLDSRLELGPAQKAPPFDLPPNWRWVVLAEIAEFAIGKTPPRGDSRYWYPEAHNWVSIADMKHYGTICETKEMVSDLAARSVFRQRFTMPGSILMSFKLTIGKVARTDISCFHNEAIISLQPPEPELADYLFRFLPSFAALQTSNNAIKGSTLNKGLLRSLPVALPPLAEQRRIVAKVDQLLDLVDQLEAQLATARTTSTDFMNTAVAELTARP